MKSDNKDLIKDGITKDLIKNNKEYNTEDCTYLIINVSNDQYYQGNQNRNNKTRNNRFF